MHPRLGNVNITDTITCQACLLNEPKIEWKMDFRLDIIMYQLSQRLLKILFTLSTQKYSGGLDNQQYYEYNNIPYAVSRFDVNRFGVIITVIYCRKKMK